MLLFGSLAIMLLTGVLLRSKISFFQNFLIPSCLIGGLLGLVLMNTGILSLAVSDLESAAYHFFNISFISVGLTRETNPSKPQQAKEGIFKGPLWMALVQSTMFPLQAVVGGLCVILLGLFSYDLFPTFGFFAPLGFEEGPGQALSFGKVWEGFGFENAATIGLTFASLGFFFSFFVGVPLVNWGIRKGMTGLGQQTLPRDLLKGIISKSRQKESAGTLTFHSGNVDTLAFQSALIGMVYTITYFSILYIGKLCPPDVASLLWAFFFFLGLVVALLTRWLMRKLGIDYVVDPGVQRRITGWSVDFLIVATVMAIKLAIVWQYILPIGLMALTSGIVTTAGVLYLGNRIWSYNLERTAAVYGAVTGTVSCGLLLLRIVDPDFETPAAMDLAIMNIFALPVIGLCSVLVNGPIWWDWSVALTVLVFFGIMVLSLAMIRLFKLWGRPRY